MPRRKGGILAQGERIAVKILKDNGKQPTPPRGRELFHGHAAHRHLAALRTIQSQKQLDERRLAAAVLPHERIVPSRFETETHPFQDGLRLPGIGKRDTPKADLGRGRLPERPLLFGQAQKFIEGVQLFSALGRGKHGSGCIAAGRLQPHRRIEGGRERPERDGPCKQRTKKEQRRRPCIDGKEKLQ